jgi:hypothetical protein
MRGESLTRGAEIIPLVNPGSIGTAINGILANGYCQLIKWTAFSLWTLSTELRTYAILHFALPWEAALQSPLNITEVEAEVRVGLVNWISLHGLSRELAGSCCALLGDPGE